MSSLTHSFRSFSPLLCRTFKGYEEVHVPPATSLPPPTEDELVKVTDLEDWAQLAFKVRRGDGTVRGERVRGLEK